MRLDRVVAAVALACLAVLMGRAAFAAPRPLRVTSLASTPLRRAYLPGANATQEICKIGMAGTPVGAVGDDSTGGTIFFGEGDTYWTYLELRPDSCPGCNSGYAGTLSTAHLALYFPYAPETVSVNISVVASVPIACHYPNYTDPSAVICDVFGATFNCQEPLTTVDFAIPMLGTCALYVPPGGSGTGFLGFEFVIASDTTRLHKPQIAVQAAARPCTSYNPVGYVNYDFVTEYQVGNPVMYAEVLHCDDVPVRRATWGRLKQMYR